LNVIFLVVFSECKTRFLTLREKHGLGLFENMMPREIFGIKRDEVGGLEKTT
jgi:hypothetical protein